MDKYDEAVEYLTRNPGEIYDAWKQPSTHEAGCLFEYCCGEDLRKAERFGCLTQVKIGIYPAETPELTEAIRADERVPYNPYDIIPATLPVFAEWQRRLDKELQRA